MRRLILAVVLAAGLAGCGSSGNQTSAAASCLKNALANQSLSSGGAQNNCADATASKVLGSGSGTKFSVSCTHQNANEYICDVTGPGTQSITGGSGPGFVQGGFYQVTYDGHSIVFQQTQ